MGPTVGHLLPPAVAGKASPLLDVLSQFEMSSLGGGRLPPCLQVTLFSAVVQPCDLSASFRHGQNEFRYIKK